MKITEKTKRFGDLLLKDLDQSHTYADLTTTKIRINNFLMQLKLKNMISYL